MQQDGKATTLDHTSPISSRGGEAPLVAHIIYRLDVGGLENGVVNLVNNLPHADFRHAIICLTDYTAFRDRIARPDVEVFALHKPSGNSLTLHVKLWRLLKVLRPDIVHTRNLAALECQGTAAAARVPVRIHGEHGCDVHDLSGRNRRSLLIRRAVRPFVHHYIGLSRDLERYLRERVRVDPARLSQIYNGVDTEKFRPALSGRATLPGSMFNQPDLIVIGTVGRMEAVKDPLNLARAFAQVADMMPEARHRLRLVMVGDGKLRPQVMACLEAAGLARQAWLPGSMENVDQIMRGLDLFVLPSLAEGISNTILEAMASGLPVVATATGGNPELVEDGGTGVLVPPASADAIAAGIMDYVRQPAVRQQHGRQARETVLERFSLAAMVARHGRLYRQLLNERQSVTGVDKAKQPDTGTHNARPYGSRASDATDLTQL